MVISVCQLLGHSEISLCHEILNILYIYCPKWKTFVTLFCSFHYATIWSNFILPNAYPYISLKVGPSSSLYQALISEHANTTNQLREHIYLRMFLLIETLCLKCLLKVSHNN